MRIVVVSVAGIVSHVASVVLQHYSHWLLVKVVEGIEAGFSFLIDLRHFGQWLLQELAEQLSHRVSFGRRDHDGWQPEFCGR